MAILAILAFDMTEAFLESIKRDFDVIVKDDTQGPWAVVFEGEVDQLVRMYNTHWHNDPYSKKIDKDSPLITQN